MASVVGTFTVDPRSRAAAKRRTRNESATGWAFVSPSVLIILGLSVVPVLWSLLLSFQAMMYLPVLEARPTTGLVWALVVATLARVSPPKGVPLVL